MIDVLTRRAPCRLAVAAVAAAALVAATASGAEAGLVQGPPARPPVNPCTLSNQSSCPVRTIATFTHVKSHAFWAVVDFPNVTLEPTFDKVVSLGLTCDDGTVATGELDAFVPASFDIEMFGTSGDSNGDPMLDGAAGASSTTTCQVVQAVTGSWITTSTVGLDAFDDADYVRFDNHSLVPYHL